MFIIISREEMLATPALTKLPEARPPYEQGLVKLWSLGTPGRNTQGSKEAEEEAKPWLHLPTY